jgi:hypothetical protein
MSMSFAPIGWPFRSKPELTSAPTDPTPPKRASGSVTAVKPVRGRGAQERSNTQPSSLPRLLFRRSPPSTTARRLRHIFKPTLIPQKSRKASSRSASRVDSATKPTSSLLHRSRVWFAAEAPLTPTIFGSPSRARWNARSATSSRYRCAELTTQSQVRRRSCLVGEAGYRSGRDVTAALGFDAAYRMRVASALPEDLRSAENSHRASGALQERPRAIWAAPPR